MLVRRSCSNVLKRSFSAKPASEGSHEREQLRKDNEVKVSRLPNGLTVVSLENNSPVSRVELIVNAGARHETVDNAGITHRIRTAAGLATNNLLAIDLGIHVGNVAGHFNVTSTREHLKYTMECKRDAFFDAVPLLGEIAVRPAFKFWELSDSTELLQIDRAQLKLRPHLRLIELLHKAAFRNGNLGNSIFSPKAMIGRHTPDMLNNFFAGHVVAGQMALVGLGVDHGHLLQYAIDHLGAADGHGHSPAESKYGGGEVRKEIKSNLTHVAIAGQGAALKDDKAVATAAVLAQIMGTGGRVPFNTAGQGRLAQAIGKATTEPFFAGALNMSYRETGLFGIHLVASHADIAAVMKSAADDFRAMGKAGVSESDVKTAKVRAKAQLFMRAEDPANLLDCMATHASLTGLTVKPSEIASSIDGVTANDVTQLAKRLSTNKLSMASLGRLDKTPYLDELF